MKSPLVGDLTYPYVHPLHVLNLARETHVSIVVPSARYEVAVLANGSKKNVRASFIRDTLALVVLHRAMTSNSIANRLKGFTDATTVKEFGN